MNCTNCKTKPQKKNSRKGLCAECTREDDLAKARLRAADQTRRLQSQRDTRLCACGCGERCRSGASYATKQHRLTHQRETKEKHRQPRVYPKAEHDRKLKHLPFVERRQNELAPKPEPVQVEGIEIRRVASPLWRPTLRNLFGDDSGQSWNAAD